jgi:hypothetical protein
MSSTEIIVIVFGLFLGYWVVSRLMTGSKPESEKPPSGDEPHQKAASDESETPK